MQKELRQSERQGVPDFMSTRVLFQRRDLAPLPLPPPEPSEPDELPTGGPTARR